MSNAAELHKAVRGAIWGDSDLLEAVGSDAYYGQVPNGKDMPYLMWFTVTNLPTEVFKKGEGFEESLIQFSIYDKRSSIANIEGIFDKLDAVFHRGTLAFDTLTFISSSRESATGPTRLDDDVWQRTADYRVRFSNA